MNDITATGPNGEKVTFQDGKWSPVEEEKNFFERFGEDVDVRSVMVGDIVDRYKNEEQGLTSTITQMVGKAGLGGVFDFMGQAIISGLRGASNVGNMMLPESVEDMLNDSAGKAGLPFLIQMLGKPD